MDARDAFELIDVREPFEFEIARIDGAKLIPLGEISGRADELDREQTFIVHCHSGRRSAQAVQLLKQGVSPTCITSKAESMPGRISSIRPYRNYSYLINAAASPAVLRRLKPRLIRFLYGRTEFVRDENAVPLR